jgi:hypothetical protein
VAGCDERLRGIRVADGAEVLEVSSGAYTGASPAIVDGVAYYGTFENDVLAVDLATKRVLWRYKNPERQFPFYASAAVAADRVVLGGRDKRVHALDRNTGALKWSSARGASFVGGHRRRPRPGLQRRAAVRTGPGHRRQARELTWRTDRGSPSSAMPAVIGTEDGCSAWARHLSEWGCCVTPLNPAAPRK